MTVEEHESAIHKVLARIGTLDDDLGAYVAAALKQGHELKDVESRLQEAISIMIGMIFNQCGSELMEVAAREAMIDEALAVLGGSDDSLRDWLAARLIAGEGPGIILSRMQKASVILMEQVAANVPHAPGAG